MGKIKLIAPFEMITGNLCGRETASKNYKTGAPHYIRLNFRKALNNKGEQAYYMSWPGMRTTFPSQAEMNRRDAFAANSALVAARLANLTKRAADKAAAKAAGMSLKAYVWSLATNGDLE